MSALRWISNLGTALIGLALTAGALHALGPMTTELTLDAAQVLQERKQCQVMFVGPSFVISQIRPHTFDQESRRRGKPLRSCTFGGVGARGIELRLHLERMLEQPWPALKLIVLDVTLGHLPGFEESNWYNPRVIQMHTFDSIGWMVESHRDEPWRRIEARTLRAHAGHLTANYLNLGVGLERLHTLALVRRAQRALGANVKLPITDAENKYEKTHRSRNRRLLKRAGQYAAKTSQAKHDREVARLVREKARARDARRKIEGAWFDDWREMTRGHGIDAIFIEAPVWRALPGELRAPAARPPLLLLDFNDPTRYPELYVRKSRGRTNHLSWQGREAYSRVLARELLARNLP